MDSKTAKNLSVVLNQLHSRRDFLELFAKGFGYSAMAAILPACGGGGGKDDPDPPPVSAPVIPQASRDYTVLKRTSFGPHRDAMAEIQSIGIDAYLQQQLDYKSIPDGDLEATIATRFPRTLESPQLLIANFPDNIFEVAIQMISATQYRQIFSKRQLYEVMVEFWSDHFNIHLVNGLGPTLKPEDDVKVIREHALGNFGNLLHASAKSPAMLFYLDNFFNQASAPNENYARELMELHTLGVEGGYTETDVKEVARCFTGWTLNFPDSNNSDYGTFVYADIIHDNNAKIVLGNPIAANGGQSDGEQVLDILASHPSTAQFIAQKLCQRFIRDDPEQDTVDAVADAFTASNGEIKDTLLALFATEAFRNTSDQKFTRPTEYLAGLIRAVAPDTDYPAVDDLILYFAQSILGQLPFYWPTPDGYPDKQSYWANTGGMLNRWRLSFFSYSSVIPGVDFFQINYPAMLGGADTLVGILDALTDTVLKRPLSEFDRDLLLDWLTNQYSLSADQAIPSTSIEPVAAIISAVLISSAYFQLR